MVDPALLELMQQVVDWHAKTGQDGYGNPTYAAEPVVLEHCYVYEVEHVTTNLDGEKETASGAVYISDVYGINHADDLRWNADSLGRIIKIETYNDEAGPYGMVVHYG